jgi:hypothetical protein
MWIIKNILFQWTRFLSFGLYFRLDTNFKPKKKMNFSYIF